MQEQEPIVSMLLYKQLQTHDVQVNQINMEQVVTLATDARDFLFGTDFKFFMTGCTLCQEAFTITQMARDYIVNLLTLLDYQQSVKQVKSLIKPLQAATFLFTTPNEKLIELIQATSKNWQISQKTAENVKSWLRFLSGESGLYEFTLVKQLSIAPIKLQLTFSHNKRFVSQNADQAAKIGLIPSLPAECSKLACIHLSPHLLLQKLFQGHFFAAPDYPNMLSTYVLRTSLNYLERTKLVSAYRSVYFQDQQLVQIFISNKNQLCRAVEFKQMQDKLLSQFLELRKQTDYQQITQYVTPFLTIDNFFNDGELLPVPLNLNMEIDAVTNLIIGNFQLNYGLQYQLNNVIGQHIILSSVFNDESSQQKLRNITKETMSLQQIPMYEYVCTSFDGAVPNFYVVNSPFIQLIFFNLIQQTNELNEEINCCLSLIRNGFLNLEHPTLASFLKYELDQSDIYKFDRNMTWEVLLETLLVILRKGQKISVTDLLRQFPKFKAFQQSVQPGLTCITAGDVEVTKANAKHKLLALIHELQHIRHSHYKAVMNPENSVLVQVLADTTSISPLTSAIHFEIKGQIGIDAGGIWRQVLGQVFDELVAQVEVTTDRLQIAKKDQKFGKRDLDFQKLNQKNPHAPTLLKAADVSFPNGSVSSVLVPHFNWYKPAASGDVYPRLTDKRSCVYYLGRLMAYCLSVGGKMPNYFCDNFWKCLTGGRLFFDDDMEKMYAAEISQNGMFKVNGTLPQSQLDFKLTDQQVKDYYPEYLSLLENVIDGTISDVDMLCVHDAAVKEIEKAGFKLLSGDGNVLKAYAKQMLVEIKSGAAFMKTYAEIRNGFRHPFSTSMLANDHEGTKFYALWLDRCFETIDYLDLIELITFDALKEEFIDREEVTSQLLDRNFVNVEMQVCDKDIKLKVLTFIKEILIDKHLCPHEEFMDFVQAVTGSRHLTGQQINVTFYNQEKRHLIVFHTCFSQMDLPLQYVAKMSKQELADYLRECASLALKSGFQIA